MSLDPTFPRRRSAPLRTARGVPRIPPRVLLAILAAVAVLGAGWMWVRDSSLAEVRDVEVTGTTSSEEAQIRAALESAGMDMTTLHVREEALRAAVARFSSVAGLRIRTDFPHVLKVEVIEHRPIAALEVGDRRIAAAGSGLLLRGVIADRDLPTIRLEASATGDHVRNANTLAALAIAGAAPEDLLRRVDRLWTGPRGMMLALRDGPDLIFGTRDDAHRKWLSAARVLADPRAAGATYLDLRIPERVAAGGLGPVVEPTPAPSITPEAQP